MTFRTRASHLRRKGGEWMVMLLYECELRPMRIAIAIMIMITISATIGCSSEPPARSPSALPQPQQASLDRDKIKLRGPRAGERAHAQVARMLDQARKQKDVVRTLCLNDKLSQIDAARRS